MSEKTNESKLARSLSLAHCGWWLCIRTRGTAGVDVAPPRSSVRVSLPPVGITLALSDGDDDDGDDAVSSGSWGARAADAIAQSTSSRRFCGIGGRDVCAAGGAVASRTRVVARREVVRFRRAVVDKRLAAVFPHVAADERARIARDAYVHLGLTLLWFLRLPALDASASVAEKLINCGGDSAALFHDFQAGVFEAKRNAIIMTGHVGMWELLPAALSSPLGHQWIVYRPLHQPALDRIVNRIRQAPQRQLVPDKDCFALLRNELLRPSPTAQLIGLVADHRASNPNARVQVDFLNQRTFFPTGAARLHLSGCGSNNSNPLTLWFAALLHNREFYESPANPSLKPFKLTIRQVSTPDPQAIPEDSQQQLQVASITQTYAKILEEVILKHPEQYLWMHDLWNRRLFVMDVS